MTTFNTSAGFMQVRPRVVVAFPVGRETVADTMARARAVPRGVAVMVLTSAQAAARMRGAAPVAA